MHERIDARHLYALNGLQRLRFNTVYQLYADQMAGIPAAVPWINLPEYVLYRLGGRRVAEYTNATHTGLVSVADRTWCAEIFDRWVLILRLHQSWFRREPTSEPCVDRWLHFPRSARRG